MNNLTIQSIKSLLTKNLLPSEDVVAGKQHFVGFEKDNQLLGTAGLEVYGNMGLFRSLAVDMAVRNQGVGKQLHQQILDHAKSCKLQSLYLLTTSAETYFESLGWIRIPRNTVPESIQQSAEFSSLCPQTAISMYLCLEDQPVREAVALFKSGLNCAQSVFSAFAPQLGLDRAVALKITSGLNGGINRKGEICGAVLGSYMALGLKYGRSESHDLAARDKTSELLREFDRRFLQRHCGLHCSELLRRNVSQPEDYEILSRERTFTHICPYLVMDAATLVSDLL